MAELRDQQKQMNLELKARVARIEAWKAVGDKFDYLGALMCVRFISGYAELFADYRDNHGVIHEMKFSFEMCVAIMERQQ